MLEPDNIFIFQKSKSLTFFIFVMAVLDVHFPELWGQLPLRERQLFCFIKIMLEYLPGEKYVIVKLAVILKFLFQKPLLDYSGCMRKVCLVLYFKLHLVLVFIYFFLLFIKSFSSSSIEPLLSLHTSKGHCCDYILREIEVQVCSLNAKDEGVVILCHYRIVQRIFKAN